MHITLVNRSPAVSPAAAQYIATAVSYQLTRHYAPAWQVVAPQLTLWTYSTAPPTGSHTITILDTPDGDDYLGYHTEEHGNYFGFVFTRPVLDAGGVILYDPHAPQNVSVASVVSHEVLEMAGDPFVNLWCEGPPRSVSGVSYNLYALENCDPVEGDSYAINVGTSTAPRYVSVSNFVFPEWTDPQAPLGSRFDQLRKLTKPFSMTPGGYMILRRGGSEAAVYGEKREEWREGLRSHRHSRRNQRAARIAAAKKSRR